MKLITTAKVVLLSLVSFTTIAKTEKTSTEFAKESQKVLQSMIENSPTIQRYYNECYGYAVFPKVTKAGATVGGAMGNGVVYKEHKLVSTSKLKQLNVGLQLGGQQYSEVIFFENKEAFDKFQQGKLKFDAQASAVALKSGVSVDAKYTDGVLVFTQAIGGLMYEASIGGQHFTNKLIEKAIID